MPAKTHYVVQGFTSGPRGRLSPMPPIEVADASAALRRAEKIADLKGGAMAFSRTGDEYEEPVILGRFGTVPESE